MVSPQRCICTPAPGLLRLFLGQRDDPLRCRIACQAVEGDTGLSCSDLDPAVFRPDRCRTPGWCHRVAVGDLTLAPKYRACRHHASLSVGAFLESTVVTLVNLPVTLQSRGAGSGSWTGSWRSGQPLQAPPSEHASLLPHEAQGRPQRSKRNGAREPAQRGSGDPVPKWPGRRTVNRPGSTCRGPAAGRFISPG